jgi:hypothetical protein
MTGTVLIRPEWNPKGRGLVQINRDLFVTSECCESEIDANYGTIGKNYFRCQNCHNLLQENNEGWNAIIRGACESFNDSTNTWREWGQFVYGLENFGLEVRE